MTGGRKLGLEEPWSQSELEDEHSGIGGIEGQAARIAKGCGRRADKGYGWTARAREGRSGTRAEHQGVVDELLLRPQTGTLRHQHRHSFAASDCIHRAFGLWQVDFLRSLNRMNDIIPGTWVEGDVVIDGEDIYAPGVDVVALRRKIGMVFQKSNPFPRSIYDNVAYGLRINHMTKSQSELDGRVERAP